MPRPLAPAEIPRLLTAEEVATQLQVSPRTVHDWAAAGEIPSIRLGSGRQSPRRFDPAAVARWLQSRAQGVER